MRSWLLLFFISVSRVSTSDFAGEALQLLAVEDGVVDHAEDQLLGRSTAEAVDDALDGANGDVLARVGGLIDERATFGLVREVAFFFEAAKDGANGRVLHGTGGGESFAARFRGRGAVGPKIVHDGLLDISQVL